MSAPMHAFWIEALTAVLLIASGLFALAGALGLLSLKNFLPAHACLGAAQHRRRLVRDARLDRPFFRARRTVAIHTWVIVILLSMTVPVTTLLLARTALFRGSDACGRTASTRQAARGIVERRTVTESRRAGELALRFAIQSLVPIG